MAFPPMGAGSPMDLGGGDDPSLDSGGGQIDPAIIQALVMALLGQSGGGQENILQMLQQLDPRALQSLVFGGALDGGATAPPDVAAFPRG